MLGQSSRASLSHQKKKKNNSNPMSGNESFLILIGNVAMTYLFIFNWRWILYIRILNVPVNKKPKGLSSGYVGPCNWSCIPVRQSWRLLLWTACTGVVKCTEAPFCIFHALPTKDIFSCIHRGPYKRKFLHTLPVSLCGKAHWPITQTPIVTVHT